MKHFYHFLYLLSALLLVTVFGVGSVSAQCDPVVVTDNTPFTDGFESGSLGCWTTEIVEGSDDWVVTGEAAYAGARCATFSSSIFGDFLNFDDIFDLLDMMENMTNLGNGSARMISPVLDLSGLNGPARLTFYRKHATMMIPQYMFVYYRTDPSSPWVYLQQYNSVSSWTEESLALPNPTATYQIAFVGTFDVQNMGDDLDIFSFMDPNASTNFASNIYIDNVQIGVTVQCDPPQNIAVNGITANSGTVTWNSPASSWSIEYGPFGFTQGTGTTVNATNPVYTITGLNPNTTYDVYIRANCSATVTSSWVRSSFTTSGGTGIGENGQPILTIAPNPTDGNVLCILDAAHPGCRVQIFDICGKMIMEEAVEGTTTEVNMTNQASGVYVLRLLDAQGVLTTQKVVRR